jgi:hypothetical protein
MEKFRKSILNQIVSSGYKRAGTLCTESSATKQVIPAGASHGNRRRIMFCFDER